MNDHPIHVYSEGEGPNTFVFMSGLGTSSPYYDFKVLYEKFLDNHQIVIIERPGYGWSDITSNDRDLRTVLEESRQALKLAGIEGPYNLVPHSLAGIEAIYWAQEYPEEVSNIFGLDPLVPGYYEQQEEMDNPLSPFITFLARSGLMRQQPGVCEDNFFAIKKGHLNENETEIACTLFMRRVMTKNMWEEYRSLEENSQLVLNNDRPNVPIYTFISSENDEDWQKILSDYSDESFLLDAHHYVHLDETDFIAKKILESLE
ncbi:alpha/beta fold hydrolase [Petrocella sp. FN5]|uniref:alpha/beta fold hydrolase n=1 Tax=Petrocella sp. FN5 TaxID=3032002 RepID=UPI0023DB8DEF|nr:alpha/beta hydrolase [Petrocella sp. FN5]MDF1616552.1 alpha/beta hydrolase [Petrocella sp. FN5]